MEINRNSKKLDDSPIHSVSPLVQNEGKDKEVFGMNKDRNLNIVEGDCLEKLKEIPFEFVDFVVTDPPYFLDGLNAGWKKGKKDAKRGTGSVGGLPVGMKFDPKQGKDLQEFINKVGHLLMPIMKHGSFGVFFSQPRLSHRLAVALEDVGFEIRDIMAWRYTKRAQFKAFSMNHFIDRLDISKNSKKIMKLNADNRKTPQLRPQFEAMVLVQKPRIGTFLENWNVYKTGLMDSTASLDGKAPSTVMTVEKPVKEKFNVHLTPKPIPLIEHLIKLFSVKGQVILDPFLGSGTTAIASKRTERSCIGIEINPEYIELAEKRLQEAGT